MLQSTEFKTIIDVVTRFPNEKACHQYLASRRWSDGIMLCPHKDCENDTAYIFKDGIRYKCIACKRVYTAKTGTFMEASKLSTIKWFVAIYLFLHKKGISSIQLAKDVGVTQKTAWFMLGRLRLALGNQEEEQLDGTVEIDETFVGGKAIFKHKRKRIKYTPGRSWKDKTPVLGMLQRGGKVKAIVVPDVTMIHIRRSLDKYVKRGCNIMGDGYQGYKSIEMHYNVRSVDHAKGWYVDGDCHTNTIEGFWSQFKKGIKGVYHKTTPKHLQKYVDEFAFRYNYRNLGAQQQLDCVISKMECRLKYKELTAA
ncbi:IS1595 family transposase [Mucilaginibacter sabulilitoris]|uniref:IS1595 family transposase n=1 Tax=Mucilaginibacter sabulilitoris TaxID=1173583 RepID=A0ABZ0TEP4_9SPHI|nr:IS1595 family transposase [Mucilaginibacter sabulilitoris]WPU91276.1 IS1595 family transposase [Mucilaginibacter sabulilitoris]